MLISMSLSATAAWSLIYWTKSIYGAQVGLAFYGFAQNYEVVYFAYIYASVSKDHFSTVSSFTHAALLAGRFVNILFTMYALPYISWAVKFVHYLTIAAQATATSFALKLPSDARMQSSAQIDAQRHNNVLSIKYGQRMFVLKLKQLKSTYANDRLIFWSIWYVCGTAVFNQLSIVLTSSSELLPENGNFVSEFLQSMKQFHRFQLPRTVLFKCVSFICSQLVSSKY